MNTSTFNWPPPFTLQTSLRARTVRLQICVRRGLRVITPSGFNPRKIPEILEKHRKWIERHWHRVKPQPLKDAPESLPERLHLVAIDEMWQITYQAKENEESIRAKVCEHSLRITITGNTHDPSKVKQALRKWLHKRAQTYLFPWLEGLSAETGLRFAQVRIRCTKTRWGSCSQERNISLSSRLLFLPPLLVEHVLLHELCHTVHMHHASPFWDLLKYWSPETEHFRKELRYASRHMPSFLESE